MTCMFWVLLCSALFVGKDMGISIHWMECFGSPPLAVITPTETTWTQRSYRKSPCYGKSHVISVIFHGYVELPEGITRGVISHPKTSHGSSGMQSTRSQDCKLFLPDRNNPQKWMVNMLGHQTQKMEGGDTLFLEIETGPGS